MDVEKRNIFHKIKNSFTKKSKGDGRNFKNKYETNYNPVNKSVELRIQSVNNTTDDKNSNENNFFENLNYTVYYLSRLSFNVDTRLQVFMNVILKAIELTLYYNNLKSIKPNVGVAEVNDEIDKKTICISFRVEAGNSFINQNLNELGELLFYFLTGKMISKHEGLNKQLDSCSMLSKEVALCVNDLLSKISEKKISLSEMLHHPLFWTYKEKIEYCFKYNHYPNYIEKAKLDELNFNKDMFNLYGKKEKPIQILPNGYQIGIFTKTKTGLRHEHIKNNMIIGLYPLKILNTVENDDVINAMSFIDDDYAVGISSQKYRKKVFEKVRIVEESKIPYIFLIENTTDLVIYKGSKKYMTIDINNKKPVKVITDENIRVVISIRSKDLTVGCGKHFSLVRQFTIGGYGYEIIKNRKIVFSEIQHSKNFEDPQSVTSFVNYVRCKIAHYADKKHPWLEYILGFGRDGKFELDYKIFWNKIIKPFPGLILHLYYNENEVKQSAENALQENQKLNQL